MAERIGRATKYAIGWIAATAVLLTARFTVFVGTSSEQRLPLAVAYVLLIVLFLGIAGTYERRRLIVRSGWRGRGTFGWLRGWVKTSAAELAADTPRVNPRSEHDLTVFNRFATWVVLTIVLVVALLVF